jgi:hypothetical protein
VFVGIKLADASHFACDRQPAFDLTLEAQKKILTFM